MDQVALQRFRAEVIARRNLPTIPVVLTRIAAVVAGERSSARDLVRLIEHDQALAGKVLRLANSAFFGFSRRVSTIPRAVILLGFSTVRNLAIGVKVWEALTVGMERARVESLWAHAALVAVTAKLLAARLHAGDPEEAFTGGLLHDVGKVVLALHFGSEYWSLVEGASAEGKELEHVEVTRLGVGHAEVGGWLTEAWTLPPLVVATVRGHHQECGPAIEWNTVRAVALANRLVNRTDFNAGQVDAEGQSLIESVRGAGLDMDGWWEVVEQVRGAEDVRLLFEVLA